MKVDIYVTVTKKEEKSECTAILFCKGNTREVHTIEETHNLAALAGINRALKKLIKPCEVHIYIDNMYIKSAVKNCWPLKWRYNEWKKADGKEPEYVDEWKKLLTMIELHQITFEKGTRNEDEWKKLLTMIELHQITFEKGIKNEEK